MDTSDVPVTLRDMWQTRPTRPRDDRKIAGVGAAIARRYDLDPVLVRVGLVAAAVTGVGVAFYLAAWAVLPGERTDGAPPPPRRLWTLVVLGVVAAASIGHVANDPSGFLLPAAAVAALLFLLHRSRAGHGTPGPAPAAAAPAAGATGTDGVTPPAWDPLGAAPFAWDLPEPGPPPAAPPRPRSTVTPITLAAALLAGGVTALVLLGTGGLTDLPVLLGVVLAVLGTGLVVGAFVRSGRGLVPFALVGIMVTWGALAAPLDRIHVGPVQDLTVAPTTPAALAPHYGTGLGDVDLDLRRMDLSVPSGATAAPVVTTVDSGMGDVEILLPPDADVHFTGRAGMGTVTFDGQQHDGFDADLHVDDLGADRVVGGRPIVLTVQAGAGDVEVRHG